jgi:hypothetical protein
MSEGKLVNVFCWKPEPGLQWRCYEGVSGITVDAESKEAAVDHFNSIWNFRTPVQWIYEAPKRPRRADERPVTAPDKAIEADAIPFTALCRRFHPDLCGKRKFTADQVMAIVNELRETTRAPK